MTRHPIYRVTSFQSVGPYTLRVHFDDQTEQVIDFRPVWPANFIVPFGTSPCSTQSRSIPMCTRWFGRTALILIRQRCTTGHNWRRRLRREHASGN